MHSLSQNLYNPRKTIIKVDIEKTNDTLFWYAILTTLAKMGFPTLWVAWIQAYISSPMISFIINGYSTTYLAISRGFDRVTPYPLIFLSLFLKTLLQFLIMPLA